MSHAEHDTTQEELNPELAHHGRQKRAYVKPAMREHTDALTVFGSGDPKGRRRLPFVPR